MNADFLLGLAWMGAKISLSALIVKGESIAKGGRVFCVSSEGRYAPASPGELLD